VLAPRDAADQVDILLPLMSLAERQIWALLFLVFLWRSGCRLCHWRWDDAPV